MKNAYLLIPIIGFILLTLISIFILQLNLRLFLHIIISLYRMIIGYALAVSIGLSFAVLLGFSKYFRMAFKALLSFFISIPTITWVPLLLIITGISEQTIIIAIFLGSFFTVVYNTLEGFDNVPKNIILLGKNLGYSRFGLLFKIYIPSSFNQILVGLKLGIAYSWRALVGAEMLGAALYGLGFLVFASRKFYDIKSMLVALLYIGLLGYFLNRLLILYIENRTVRRWGIE